MCPGLTDQSHSERDRRQVQYGATKRIAVLLLSVSLSDCRQRCLDMQLVHALADGRIQSHTGGLETRRSHLQPRVSRRGRPVANAAVEREVGSDRCPVRAQEMRSPEHSAAHSGD